MSKIILNRQIIKHLAVKGSRYKPKNVIWLLNVQNSVECLQTKNKFVLANSGCLNFVLDKSKKSEIRFFTSSNIINNHSIYVINKKCQDKKKIHLKKQLLLLHYLFQKKKKLPFFFIKEIKGGFSGTVLGSFCFVPKSLYRKNSLIQSLVIVNFFYKKMGVFAKENLIFIFFYFLNIEKTKRRKRLN
jgi:hypothetical protein